MSASQLRTHRIAQSSLVISPLQAKYAPCRDRIDFSARLTLDAGEGIEQGHLPGHDDTLSQVVITNLVDSIYGIYSAYNTGGLYCSDLGLRAGFEFPQPPGLGKEPVPPCVRVPKAGTSLENSIAMLQNSRA